MTIFKPICGKPARSGFACASALAFLALLGGGSAEAEDSTTRGTNDTGPLEWGPQENGVRTGLSAREQGFVLGKPMLFRLTIENLGTRAVRVETAQVAVNSSMVIEGIDGRSVPYIAGSVQTGMGEKVLNPGERAVLFDGLDVADQYLLTSPGTYEVRFRNNVLPDIGQANIPASNVVTIRVTDGPVKPSRLLARTLFDAMQASGWHLEWVKEGDVAPIGRLSVNGTTLGLRRDGPTKFKGDGRALIWVTASPAAIASPKPDEKHLSPAEAIGHCAWGDVYLWSATASPEELSTIRKLSAAALKIDEG